MKKLLIFILTVNLLTTSLLEAGKNEWLIWLGLAAAMMNHSGQSCETTIQIGSSNDNPYDASYDELNEINLRYFRGTRSIVPIYFRGHLIGHALVENKEVHHIDYILYGKAYMVQSKSYFDKYIPTTIYALRFNQ